nr:arylsulfatase [uncultured Draconibacterium sp.]
MIKFFTIKSIMLLLISMLLTIHVFSAKRPNVILIMADDMGYSDLGCYGGEIPTPNIDGLAQDGVRFTQFYNTSRCCPTRASLLTGIYQHEAGVGHMTTEGPYDFDYGVDGYRGQLNRNCITIAEVLKEAGYKTYMTGKWHLGSDMDDRPLQRGFDKYFGCLRGAFNYFKPEDLFMYGNDILEEPDPETFYTTDAFTDTAVNWINDTQSDQPFFLYMAYNAPHWPLQAKKEDVDKFVGKYMTGWDELRKNRFARQVDMGLFDSSLGISPRDEHVRSWEEVPIDQKERSDFRMAVYAAQVFSIDENVGKILSALENKGELDNTLILVLSDNGACAEPYSEFGGGDFEDVNNPQKSGAISIGRGWANLCNTPFRQYKNFPNEGGIATPFIAHWPAGISPELNGQFINEICHITDVMPTLVNIAKGQYPKRFKGNYIFDEVGVSFVPLLKKEERNERNTLFFEHENNCGVRSGDWKIIGSFGKSDWELYHITEDRNELNNLASKYPQIVARLAEEWREWALHNRVIPKGDSSNKGYANPEE